MKTPSTLAAWMVAVAYAAILFALVRMALDPDGNFVVGYLLATLYFITATGPVSRLLVWSMERGADAPPGPRAVPIRTLTRRGPTGGR
jgi:hypothetical protein